MYIFYYKLICRWKRKPVNLIREKRYIEIENSHNRASKRKNIDVYNLKRVIAKRSSEKEDESER